MKSQGIKTKLVPWIQSLIPSDFEGRWVEPFMGTGAVSFNVFPEKSLLCDTNPHLINFYLAIQSGDITPELVKSFLVEEGQKLLEIGGEHYYFIRERFNRDHSPLDFLFLNRAGFNGMIRFNRKGGFNIPFCKKPNRFAQAYVTKIVNQVTNVKRIIESKDIVFKCQDFGMTLSEVGPNDLVYCDPPYIGRHVDYFNSWDETHEMMLFDSLSALPCNFILSTWHHNDYRKNEFIDSHWSKFQILTREHFYHVGGSEKNRNPMIEAIVTTLDTSAVVSSPEVKAEQLSLLDSVGTL